MQDQKVGGANQGEEWERRGAAEKCTEQEAAIDGFEEEAVRMWEERDRLEEKDSRRRMRSGWKPRGLVSKGRRRGQRRRGHDATKHWWHYNAPVGYCIATNQKAERSCRRLVRSFFVCLDRRTRCGGSVFLRGFFKNVGPIVCG